MDVKHEMREALMAYAVKATEVSREEIERSMSEEDHEDLMSMVNIVSEVAERYGQEIVNTTISVIKHPGS
jgi:uncharacterized protein (UPF0210 family)